MSRIVFASTFGAVAGPLMIGPTEHAGEVWFGLDRYSGPWLFGAAFFVVAADHGGPVAPRSARCIRRGAGRRRHTATARTALDAASSLLMPAPGWRSWRW